ncbi:MAG: sigma-70 family RNA polymerase sigma factor [Flavobacteriales bacterium]|nr:sigma-70 family RNA polymerase sigma factor [Flavobacteriales bacterium]
MEDHQAIPLAIAGDQRAFGVLIGRYKHMVYTVARRVLRNDMDAEEVTQDTFVKAFRRLSEFQGSGKFSTWLYSIAYRTAISALRNRKEHNTSTEDLQATGRDPSQDPAPFTNDRKAVLEWALSTLPAEDAGLMTMFYLEELSVEEIVTISGLGASNVKVRLHRSRKKLFEVLQHHLKEEAWTLITNE